MRRAYSTEQKSLILAKLNLKGQHLLRIFNGSSICCYKLTDYFNNRMNFAHIEWYNRFLRCKFLTLWLHGVCLLVCLGVFVPLENFSLIWKRYRYRWRAVKFWPMFGTHGHWAVSVLKRATPTVKCGICLWLPVTLTPIAVLGLSRLGFEHPTFQGRTV